MWSTTKCTNTPIKFHEPSSLLPNSDCTLTHYILLRLRDQCKANLSLTPTSHVFTSMLTTHKRASFMVFLSYGLI